MRHHSDYINNSHMRLLSSIAHVKHFFRLISAASQRQVCHYLFRRTGTVAKISSSLQPSLRHIVTVARAERNERRSPTKDFVAAIETIKPTTIIGVSTIGGAFTQTVVEAMSRINERPVILALSNPTEHAECTAEQAYTWSKGKAIYAAGVQFAPVHANGQTFLPRPSQQFLTSSRRSEYGHLRHAGEPCLR